MFALLELLGITPGVARAYGTTTSGSTPWQEFVCLIEWLVQREQQHSCFGSSIMFSIVNLIPSTNLRQVAKNTSLARMKMMQKQEILIVYILGYASCLYDHFLDYCIFF